MTRAHAGNLAKIGKRQRVGDMVFHCLYSGQYGVSVRAVTLREAGPLRTAGGTHIGMHEPVADPPGEVRTVMLGDKGVHHVQWRCPAGAGDAVAVHDIKGTLQEEAGVPLGQGGGVLPVKRHPPVFHDAGIGEYRRPAGDAAQHAAMPGLMPQPLKHPVVLKADRVAAGDDECEVVCAGRFSEPGDRDRSRGRTV